MSRKHAPPPRPQPAPPARPTPATPTFAGMPAAGQPTTPVTPPTDQAIREAAYFKWEAAGRPDGDGTQFWIEAEQELHRTPR